jgi:outer membrane receptor protein involved in Fe transport
LASNDLLPALSLVYALGEQTNLRASYGTTVARPQLRELAPFLFFDFARRRNVQGNPDLQRSLIYNADARWELFPAAGQIVAVSAFYKYFSQPIERVIFDSSNNVTFQNVASAWTAGAEVELSTKLGFLHPALEPLTFGLNVTLAWSRVRLRPEQVGVQTDAERPMQGQSPYVVNVALNYAHPNSKTELTLLYNFFGPRIDEVGANFLPSVYERPFHRLDASVSHALAKGWRLRVSGSNLLNQPVSFQQGGLPIVRYRPGVQGGVTLSYSR